MPDGGLFLASPERIAAVAVLLPGVPRPLTLPAPARHVHLLRQMVMDDELADRVGHADQGFVTTHGRYVCRCEAMRIALAAGQVAPPQAAAGVLYSEDLW